MGLAELPNGMQYYNFSEELSSWLSQLYAGLTPVTVGIIVVLTITLIAIVIIATLYTIGHQVGAIK